MKHVEDHWELDGRNRVLAIGVGLTPLWLLAFANLTSSHFGGGLVQPTAADVLARERMQIVVYGLGGLLMLAGAIGLWRARSDRFAVGAILFLTVPALFITMFGPAFVLMLGNLAR